MDAAVSKLSGSPWTGRDKPEGSSPGGAGRNRTCDFCRERQVKCDYQDPCKKCRECSIPCRRDYKLRKRGPKTGHGRRIEKIRARENLQKQGNLEGSDEVEAGLDDGLSPIPMSPDDQHRSPHQRFMDLIPQCIELYYENIYPIMPVLYMPTVRAMVKRRMTPPEKALIYAVCAMTCLHMSGQSPQATGSITWVTIGRFFLGECVSVRHSYDFMGDMSLYAVITSFWLSTSFFEVNEYQKSWRYLSDALAVAGEMGLHDETTYAGLSPEEALCRRRVFWQFFVTERSFAIFRHKPTRLRKTPEVPTTWHHYESPDIHHGFLQLISTYSNIDETFVDAWNDSAGSHVPASTYLGLQTQLATPPTFPSSQRRSDSTAIQMADLLITTQWLRLAVWRGSLEQGLLNGDNESESMRFSYPLEIGRRTAAVIHTLSPDVIEVHGMGIFEKIFDIGNWLINVMHTYDSLNVSNPQPGALRSVDGGGMDFLRGSDMGVLGVGRVGANVDLVEFFVKTLSSRPPSRTKFAERLLEEAWKKPSCLKSALSPSLALPLAEQPPLGVTTMSVAARNAFPGSLPPGHVYGEITENDAESDACSTLRSRTVSFADTATSVSPITSDFPDTAVPVSAGPPGDNGISPVVTPAVLDFPGSEHGFPGQAHSPGFFKTEEIQSPLSFAPTRTWFGPGLISGPGNLTFPMDDVAYRYTTHFEADGLPRQVRANSNNFQ